MHGLLELTVWLHFEMREMKKHTNQRTMCSQSQVCQMSICFSVAFFSSNLVLDVHWKLFSFEHFLLFSFYSVFSFSVNVLTCALEWCFMLSIFYVFFMESKHFTCHRKEKNLSIPLFKYIYTIVVTTISYQPNGIVIEFWYFSFYSSITFYKLVE